MKPYFFFLIMDKTPLACVYANVFRMLESIHQAIKADNKSKAYYWIRHTK